MAIFLIALDLHKQEGSAELHQLLGDWKAKLIVDSAYLVSQDASVRTLSLKLRPYLDSEDGMVIIELDPACGWSTWHANKEVIQWLQEYMPEEVAASQF
jgi:hypothetical protein